MIQRGALEARLQPELAVTAQSRLQRQIIRSVGDSGAVLRLRSLRTISMHQAVKGLEPHAGTRLCRGSIRLSVQGRVYVSHINGAFPRDRLCNGVGELAQIIADHRQRFGVRNLRHGHCGVLRAAAIRLERHNRREHGRLILEHLHAAGREGAAIVQVLRGEEQLPLNIAGAQEVRVDGVQGLPLNRTVCGNDRLGEHLAAKGTRLLAGERHTAEYLIAAEGGGGRLDGGEVQHPHEVLSHSGLSHAFIFPRFQRGRRWRRVGRHTLRRARPAPTASERRDRE